MNLPEKTGIKGTGFGIGAAVIILTLFVAGCASSGKSTDGTSSATPSASGDKVGNAMPGGAPPSGGQPSGAPPSGTPPSGGMGPGGTPPGGMASGGKPGSMPGGAPPSSQASAALASSSTSKYFKDLDATTAAFNAYIDYLYAKGYIQGYTDMYYPARSLSRADLASMLYAKYKYAKEGFGYGDVATDAWYYEAVMRGKAVKVFEDTKYFNPDDAVTREQAALWMYASELQNGMPSEMASADVSAMKDSSTIAETSKKAVATMVKLGILTLDAKGNFNPGSTFTRAEIAPVMYRLSLLGGGAAGPGGAGGPGSGGTGGMSQSIDHGTSANTVSSDVSGKTYASSGDTENAVRVEGKATVTLSGITVKKTGGEAGTGDSSNFYGSNAGLLALDGASVTIDNASVTTSARGGNGIFAYGSGTKVAVRNATIRTTKDSSGGVMVTGGGAMTVSNCDIETQGGSSAALRTDRGGGTLDVKGGTYVTHGNGSPAIYCTAAISASDATLTATGSEAVVVEGKNSVNLVNCAVSGKMVKENVENIQNVMIYQSMSGDAASGKSSFTMTGGSLASGAGDMLYVTNTSCTVKLSNVALKLSSDYLLKVVGNDARNGWGVVGKNGGQCDFVADNQVMGGKIKVDSISTLNLSLTNGTRFTGAINAAQEGGAVSVKLDSTSTWTLTADSYIGSFSGSLDSVQTNGHILSVAGTVAKK